MTTIDDTLVCGRRVQWDTSGVGHCWRDVDADDMPATAREEIEAEILDAENSECDDYIACNGQHYRWYLGQSE